MSVLKVPASNLSWHLLTTLLKAALGAAVKDLSAPLSLSKTVFEREGREKKKPSIQGEKGISSQHRLMKRLTWAPSTPPPIKSKWFVFNGLLH